MSIKPMVVDIDYARRLTRVWLLAALGIAIAQVLQGALCSGDSCSTHPSGGLIFAVALVNVFVAVAAINFVWFWQRVPSPMSRAAIAVGLSVLVAWQIALLARLAVETNEAAWIQLAAALAIATIAVHHAVRQSPVPRDWLRAWVVGSGLAVDLTLLAIALLLVLAPQLLVDGLTTAWFVVALLVMLAVLTLGDWSLRART